MEVFLLLITIILLNQIVFARLIKSLIPLLLTQKLWNLFDHRVRGGEPPS